MDFSIVSIQRVLKVIDTFEELRYETEEEFIEFFGVAGHLTNQDVLDLPLVVECVEGVSGGETLLFSVRNLVHIKDSNEYININGSLDFVLDNINKLLEEGLIDVVSQEVFAVTAVADLELVEYIK